jgi:hypothetical protein
MEDLLSALKGIMSINDADTVIWMSPTGGNPWTALSADSWSRTVLESPSLDSLHVRVDVPGDWASDSAEDIAPRADAPGEGGAGNAGVRGKRGRGRGRGRGGGRGVRGRADSSVMASTRRSTRLTQPSTKVTANVGIAKEIADAKTIQQAIRARKRASKTLVAEFPFD